MKRQFYLEKLFESEEFKKFKSENQDAYLCSGFFSIDKKGKDNQQHLDFYVPSTKKMFSFRLENEIALVPLESYDERIPEKLDQNLDFDFNEIENMIVSRMKQENVKKEIQKMLFTRQNMEGKNFFICTIFISGMGILKVTIDLDEKQITDFGKKSFFDFMKIVKK